MRIWAPLESLLPAYKRLDTQAAFMALSKQLEAKMQPDWDEDFGQTQYERLRALNELKVPFWRPEHWSAAQQLAPQNPNRWELTVEDVKFLAACGIDPL